MRLFKNIIIGIIVSVLVVSLAAVAYLHYSYNQYPPHDNDYTVNVSNLKYFYDSYDECRAEFIETSTSLKSNFDSINIFNLKVESRIDTFLTIDFCYLHPEVDKHKLLIISSGVHGIEAFTGSAIQQMLMKEVLTEVDLDNLGVLFVHGFNPYGFKYLRRVSENNVDLNRNCDTDMSLYETKNEAYGELNTFLNPKTPVDLSSADNKFFYLKSMLRLLKASIATLRQAILQGQYTFSSGLYFGGFKPESQVKGIEQIIRNIAKDYEELLIIDLHTGYGERGKMHLFPESKGNEMVKEKVNQLFEGYNIDWGDNEDFYTITGDFTNYLGSILPGKDYYPMVFEYGTLNSQTTLGSIRSLHNMIIENQGFHYGFDSKKDEEVVKDLFIEMYYPTSPEWRSKVIDDSRNVFKDIINRFTE